MRDMRIISKTGMVVTSAAALLLGATIGGAAGAAPATPTHTVTAKVPGPTKTVKDTASTDYWKGCSAEWFRIAETEGVIMQDFSKTVADALDSGDWVAGRDETNAITARIKALTATVPDDCRQ